MENKMTVLVVEPEKVPYVKEIDPGLQSLQSEVQGWIQAVYPCDEPVALICNDEGKLLGLPPNRMLFDPESSKVCDVVAGDFFVCNAPPDAENFESLTDEQITRYTKRFQALEIVLGGTPW